MPGFEVCRNARGTIEAFIIYEPKDDGIYVETWIGPARYIRQLRSTFLAPYKFIAYHKDGVLHRHNLNKSYGTSR